MIEATSSAELAPHWLGSNVHITQEIPVVSSNVQTATSGTVMPEFRPINYQELMLASGPDNMRDIGELFHRPVPSFRERAVARWANMSEDAKTVAGFAGIYALNAAFHARIALNEASPDHEFSGSVLKLKAALGMLALGAYAGRKMFSTINSSLSSSARF